MQVIDLNAVAMKLMAIMDKFKMDKVKVEINRYRQVLKLVGRNQRLLRPVPVVPLQALFLVKLAVNVRKRAF